MANPLRCREGGRGVVAAKHIREVGHVEVGHIEVIRLEVEAHEHNRDYLKTKQARLGHLGTNGD